MVRNVWRGTNDRTGQRLLFNDFVLWRLADGKIAERWATLTAPWCNKLKASNPE
ncbi:hypothetical protein GCM10028818_56950 [Spirosoma horti]